MSKPIGGSEYKLFNDLPEELKKALLTPEDIKTRVMRKYICE